MLPLIRPNPPGRVPSGDASRFPRLDKGLRGDLPSPALSGSGPWGSPFSLVAARLLSLPADCDLRQFPRSSSLSRLADTPNMPGTDMTGQRIIGPRYREDLCLDAAAALEEALGVLTSIDPR